MGTALLGEAFPSPSMARALDHGVALATIVDRRLVRRRFGILYMRCTAKEKNDTQKSAKSLND